MLLERLEAKKGFTKTEEIIADYLLKNPFKINGLTAEELGKRTYTSKASVFRFCKKIDIKSYDNLKYQLEKEMNENSRVKKLLDEEPIGKDTNLNEIINIIPSIYETAISETKLKLDINALSRIVGYLKRAEKIDIYCGEATFSVAEALKFKLMSIGIDSSTHAGINEHYIMANKNRNIVAILLSFTGQNPTTIKIGEYLKDNGIFLLGVGGAESSILKNLCNEYIETFNKELVMSMEILTPLTTTMYIFDILFAALLINDYDKNLEYSIDVIKNKYIDPPDKSFYADFLDE